MYVLINWVVFYLVSCTWGKQGVLKESEVY